MMTCKELTEIVTDYLEGRMSFMQRLQFRFHVGMCQHCRAYLRQMKMTIKTLGTLPDEPIPADVRDELLERFRSIRRGGGAPAAAPAGLSRSLGILALIERIGSKHGWALASLIVAGVIAVLVASGPAAGSVGEGTRCLLVEIGFGGALISLLGLFAWTRRSRLSASTWVVVAMTGSLAGFGMLQATCPMSHIAPHVFLFHLGGLVLAGLLGLGTSRLQMRR
jgi:hypothetical protein